MSGKRKRGILPLPVLILLEICMIGAALVVFAFFHHVLPREEEGNWTISERPGIEREQDIRIARLPAESAPAEKIGAAEETEPAAAPAGQTPEPEETEAPVLLPELTVAPETTEPAAVSPEPTAVPETMEPAAFSPEPTAVPETMKPAAVSTEPTAVPETMEPAAVSPEPTEETGIDIFAAAPAETAALPEETGQPGMEDVLDATLEPTPVPDPVGYFGNTLAGHFTDGEVIQEENHYQSGNLSITLSTGYAYDCKVHIADIYIRDISCFRTVLAKDTYGRNLMEQPKTMAQRAGAVVSLTGDYYSLRSKGVVLRNGVLYRSAQDPNQDTCVLYWDGRMETFEAGTIDIDNEIAKGAYQIWSFGPMLLDENGKKKMSFHSGVEAPNPRSVIGYFEPGHYCFVAVDGRNKDSEGIAMKNLSELMEYLGCVRAYNLDGGRTAQMLAGTAAYNVPYQGGREVSDMLVIVDPDLKKE